MRTPPRRCAAAPRHRPDGSRKEPPTRELSLPSSALSGDRSQP
jgi:hypothetical protein